MAFSFCWTGATVPAAQDAKQRTMVLCQLLAKAQVSAGPVQSSSRLLLLVMPV
jgi:hypothetical protein